ncbi:MAG: hypothetical protein HS113_21575 [Verrucomicrobiales bacterium]|nr:hypothetical protein [Verrucomicrobiales bacterium]
MQPLVSHPQPEPNEPTKPPAGARSWICLGITCVVWAAGCSLARAPQEVVSAVVPGGRSKPLDPVDLQVQIQRFADDYAVQTTSAVEEYVRRAGTDAARVQGLRWKLAVTTAAISIASGPQPKANLLDLVSLAVLNRQAIEAFHQNDPQGSAFEPWLETSRALETSAWDLATSRLPPEQVAELRSALEEWQARNPTTRSLFAARPQEFASLVKTAQPRTKDVNSVFSLVGLDPTAGLDPAVREVTLSRLFAERALYTLQRFPLLLRWQTELLGEDLARQAGVQTVLTNTARLTESMDRISLAAQSVSETAAQLPDQVAAEREALLDALQEQESKLNDLAVAVDKSFVSAGKMSDSLGITITHFDALMKRFGVGEPKAAAPPPADAPPFNILDYARTAEQMSAMARDLDALIASVNASVPQLERLSRQAGADLERVVNRGFRLGLVLIGVLLAGAVLAGLAYRYLAERLTPRASSPNGR